MSTVEYYPNGNKRLEIFRNNEKLIHRDNAPAKIFYAKNSKIFAEIYYTEGQIHRSGDKPAEIYYTPDSKISSETYYTDGKISREGDKPAVIAYDTDGSSLIPVRETYYTNGQIHREGDKPAVIEYDAQSAPVPVREIYYTEGQIHRSGDKPAVIEYEYGKPNRETYYTEGQIHREEKPAVIEYEDGFVLSETYFIDNSPFRKNKPSIVEYFPKTNVIKSEKYMPIRLPHLGPSIIEYHSNGNVKHEKYFLDNDWWSSGSTANSFNLQSNGHRDDGPADIVYFENGNIEEETYFFKGTKHRDDGPAFIRYNPDGEIRREEYYENGEYLKVKIYDEKGKVDEASTKGENLQIKIDALNGGELTDEIKLEIKELFRINPYATFNILNQIDTDNMYLDSCTNITFKSDDVFIEYDDSTGKFWCYEKDEVKDKGEYNPYTLKNLKRTFDSNIKDKSIKLSDKVLDLIHVWTGNFTQGKVFFKIDKDIATELSKTLDKNKTYILYRGLQFNNNFEKDKFLKNSKCNEKYCESIEFKTFTSWTYNFNVASNFSRNIGVILKKEFKADELLADLTKIDMDSLVIDSESEVIALPFKGGAKLMNFQGRSTFF